MSFFLIRGSKSYTFRQIYRMPQDQRHIIDTLSPILYHFDSIGRTGFQFEIVGIDRQRFIIV